jgi:RNA polymerase sigma factor (sigma-70 family)
MIALENRVYGAGDAQNYSEAFLEFLPDILRYARPAARGLNDDAREEFIQEVVCNCWVTYKGLCRGGNVKLAYPTVLARFAIMHARSGRRVGGSLNSRDVASNYAQRTHSFTVDRLDRFDQREMTWREIAVEDKRSTPAEIAALRIDFQNWLKLLPPRQSQLAEVLATGESTQNAAKQFRISPARISQIRRELKQAWHAFQGESPTGACSFACA